MARTDLFMAECLFHFKELNVTAVIDLSQYFDINNNNNKNMCMSTCQLKTKVAKHCWLSQTNACYKLYLQILILVIFTELHAPLSS